MARSCIILDLARESPSFCNIAIMIFLSNLWVTKTKKVNLIRLPFFEQLCTWGPAHAHKKRPHALVTYYALYIYARTLNYDWLLIFCWVTKSQYKGDIDNDPMLPRRSQSPLFIWLV